MVAAGLVQGDWLVFPSPRNSTTVPLAWPKFPERISEPGVIC